MLALLHYFNCMLEVTHSFGYIYLLILFINVYQYIITFINFLQRPGFRHHRKGTGTDYAQSLIYIASYNMSYTHVDIILDPLQFASQMSNHNWRFVHKSKCFLSFQRTMRVILLCPSKAQTVETSSFSSGNWMAHPASVPVARISIRSFCSATRGEE